MNFSLTFPVHTIPLWFLVLSLFLPRICILILFWIYQDQGITIWFLLHVIALIVAWSGGGHTVYRRRRVVEV